MKRFFIILLAIVALTFFVGACDSGSGGGSKTNVDVNIDTGGNSDNNGSSDGSDSGTTPPTGGDDDGVCQNENPNIFDVDDTYSVKDIPDPWQLKVPNGQTFFYIEKVLPENLNCAGDAFLVKVKLAYRTGLTIRDFEKGTGFYVPIDWVPKDGSPIKISEIFPEFDFDYQWAPEPPAGTEDFKTLWVGYSKRPTRATAGDCKSPPYYVNSDNWQWSAVTYFEGNSKGNRIIIEVRDGKVKAVSAIGSELVDIDCDRNIAIPTNWKPTDGNPVDLRYAMSGRWAGYGTPGFYEKSWAPEPPEGTGSFETLWAIY